MDLGVQGKVAIVTGGAAGIGAAIVQGFVNEGCNVAIADINYDGAQRLAERISNGQTKILSIMTDVSKKASADDLVSMTMAEFGKIDILVNVAGTVHYLSFLDVTEDEWDRVMNTNAKGVYLVIKAVVPHMIAAKGGKIVNISSTAAKEGLAGFSHYAASKFAVTGLTQSLAKELAQYNINVNAVCPGVVRTAMWESNLDDILKKENLPRSRREQVFNSWIQQIPFKRPQTPEDIANVVLFLSSEVSINMTGTSIHVNGGMRMD